MAIPASASMIRLQIDLEQLDINRDVWQVTISNDKGEICTINDLRTQQTSSGRILSPLVDAALLPPGDYEITISGQSADHQVKDANHLWFSITR